MSNIKYKWVFNNNYNTKQLESVQVKKTIKDNPLGGISNGSSPPPSPPPNAMGFLINSSSIGDSSGHSLSLGGQE